MAEVQVDARPLLTAPEVDFFRRGAPTFPPPPQQTFTTPLLPAFIGRPLTFQAFAQRGTL